MVPRAAKHLKSLRPRSPSCRLGSGSNRLAFPVRKASSGQTVLLYTLSILILFICLAALYESWSIPLSVILVTPLGVLGALLGAVRTWKFNNVHFQVALLTNIGLASKNAILIVEFAKEQHEAGKTLVEAALEAARLRLRPVLMTSIEFILGCVPLVTVIMQGRAHRMRWEQQSSAACCQAPSSR